MRTSTALLRPAKSAASAAAAKPKGGRRSGRTGGKGNKPAAAAGGRGGTPPPPPTGPTTTAPPAVADPRSAILLSSYRACLKEIDRAMRVHQGNATNIVRAVFGPMMDMETLRRAALATKAPLSVAQQQAKQLSAGGGSGDRSTYFSPSSPFGAVVAPPLHQPPHAFIDTLRPPNVRVSLPGALRMFVGDTTTSAAAAAAVAASTTASTTAAADADESNSLKKAGGGKKKGKKDTVAAEKSALTCTITRPSPVFEHPDAAALAALLRLFFQPITSEAHPLFGCIPSSAADAAAGADVTPADDSKAKKMTAKKSKKKTANSANAAAADAANEGRAALIRSILEDPQFQTMALARSFEIVKKLREATRGYPYPTPSAAPPAAVPAADGAAAAVTTATSTAAAATSSSTTATAETNAPTTTTTAAASSNIIDIYPAEEQAAPFVNQCIQIVTQRVEGPPPPTGGGAVSQGNAFDGPAAAEEDSLVTDGDRHRSLFSRVGFPLAGTGDLASVRHLCVPNDPFHVNNLADDSSALLAPELAVIEALAAMLNATRGEIPSSVVKTAKVKKFSLYGSVAEENTKAEAEEKDDAFTFLPSIYSHSTPYVRTTPGALLRPVVEGQDRLDSTTKSMLAPTIAAVPPGLESAANPTATAAAESTTSSGSSSAAKPPLPQLTAADIMDPTDSLAALNSEFGGVRAPFAFAPTAKASAAEEATSNKSKAYPAISTPRPLDTAAGATLLTFKELPYMREDLPWYQCASPHLYDATVAATNNDAVDTAAAVNENTNEKKSGKKAKGSNKNGGGADADDVALVPLSRESLLPKAIKSLRTRVAESPRLGAAANANNSAAADALVAAPTSVGAAEALLRRTATAIVDQIPTKTTTVTNGIIAVTVSTTYVGRTDASTNAGRGAHHSSSSSSSATGLTSPSASASSSLHNAATPHVFQYRVTIRNISGGVEEKAPDNATPNSSASSGSGSYLGANVEAKAVKVTVVSRHWAFIDAAGQTVKEVVGPGVVGNSPRLMPGEHFTYESGTTMASDAGGYMRGSLQCVAILDDEDNAIIEALEARRVLAEFEAKRQLEGKQRLEELQRAQAAAALAEAGGSSSSAAGRAGEVGGSVLSSSRPPSVSTRSQQFREQQQQLQQQQQQYSAPRRPSESAVAREASRLLGMSFRSTQSCFDVAIAATALRK